MKRNSLKVWRLKWGAKVRIVKGWEPNEYCKVVLKVWKSNCFLTTLKDRYLDKSWGRGSSVGVSTSTDLLKIWRQNIGQSQHPQGANSSAHIITFTMWMSRKWDNDRCVITFECFHLYTHSSFFTYTCTPPHLVFNVEVTILDSIR